ncbi:b74574ef-6b25-4751-a576-441f0d494b23 [Sclerotinia trifoliorum]|uniref:B74574ef-6b25-4751-a576-441f0d494b23 n=1 Tax=Sclerotinia trifoliorum TaxID=28548 RepID=A0A8H2VPQ3_9HELO|nr:b74574ef-6b25-4751-a576-441f0d494b23 [Sclerotinia trifoliorum]
MVAPKEPQLNDTLFIPKNGSTNDTTAFRADNGAQEKIEATKHRSWRFWLVYLCLCWISFLSALDGSIITTALPTITDNIGGKDKFVWIANCFVLASTVIQPCCAQLSNIFGRRIPMIISVALFALGSGIAGGSNGVAMMIAGRTVQGLGSGGIYLLVDLITCDLVSPRERGKYLGIMLSAAAVGSILGPVFGGLLAEANWRWVFYINLPISGVVLVVMTLFLRLKKKEEPSWKAVVENVDWIGNIIFIGSMCSLLIALISGGVVYSWSSWRVIVPLVIGVLGWGGFHIYEMSRFCKTPAMPPSLFAKRNTAIGYFLAFDAAMLLRWLVFYLPIYFQGVRGTTPGTSGVDILPYNAFIIPASMVAGALMSKLGIYRALHGIGFALVALGSGLLTLLDQHSSTALWVIFEMFIAIGEGLLIPTILPAIQTSLPSSEIASATGAYAFIRSFAFVWGVTIPAIIFNGEFDHYSSYISDESVRNALSGGAAYGNAAGTYRESLPSDVQAEIVHVYTAALNKVWQVAIAFALLGFILSFCQSHIELKREVNSDFGLKEKDEGAGTLGNTEANAGKDDK